IGDIKSDSFKDIDELASGLDSIHTSYSRYTWDWTTKILSEIYDIDVSKIETEQLIELVTKWESDSIKLDRMILSDAGKEFDNTSKIGFGIDGDEEIADKDFEAVRGILEENKFITGVKKEMEQIEEKAGRLKGMLNKI
ncbi:MAG: DUF4954 family protein, partial [Bacteroidales bacterium]|nr:DUF4954 family protein [Bacteroidales bacterium]